MRRLKMCFAAYDKTLSGNGSLTLIPEEPINGTSDDATPTQGDNDVIYQLIADKGKQVSYRRTGSLVKIMDNDSRLLFDLGFRCKAVSLHMSSTKTYCWRNNRMK